MVTGKTYLFGYYKNETQSFFKTIKRLHKDFDANELHRLRISIKRIRTVYRLLEEFSGDKFNAAKHYSFFQKTFNIAGKVRELQVNRLLLLENPNLSGALKSYLHHLDAKEEKYSSSLVRNLKHFDIPRLKKDIKKIKQRCKKITDQYFLRQGHKLINSEVLTIQELLDIPYKNAHIHKIRKHLKTLYSVVKLSHSIQPTKELKKLEIAIKETEELLGMWHDKTVLLSSFKEFTKNNTKQAMSIKKFTVTVDKQNKVLLDASISKIGSIFKSLPKQL